MKQQEYKYGVAALYIPDIDPAVNNVLKHWARAADMSLATLARFILTDAAQKKMEGKIKLTKPEAQYNAEWIP